MACSDRRAIDAIAIGNAAWLQMPKYKMYILSDDGHVTTRANLYCDGVQQAKELAKALVDSKPVELWKGLIRIERFDPTH